MLRSVPEGSSLIPPCPGWGSDCSVPWNLAMFDLIVFPTVLVVSGCTESRTVSMYPPHTTLFRKRTGLWPISFREAVFNRPGLLVLDACSIAA